MTAKEKNTRAIHLGGPVRSSAVEPFLYNFFCDPTLSFSSAAWLRAALAR